MKTVKEINQEIKDLILSLKEADRFKSKSIKKRIELLKMCKLYVESKPRPEFLEAEVKDIERKIDVLNGRFGLWNETNASKFRNSRAAYNTESGINSLKAQLKAVRYLVKT
jgi:hypothetical protein